MKQTLDELFEPRKDYQMIENVLQEIGITRQEVEEYTCEHKKKELEDKLELFMNDIRIAEETRTLTTEHFLVANYILSEIKSLERSFGTEKTNNNLNCKILFNKTMSSVEFYLNKIENPKHGIFFNNYQKRINILEMFEKKLSFTDREQNIVENIKHELNKKAVKVTVQAYNEYLKIPVAERAKEPNYTLNQAFINTVYETINGINNSSTKYELTKLVEELDVKNKVDMSKQRELILEQEKKLCGYVDSKINSTMEEFHKAIEIWYNFEITYFGIMEKTLENITQQAKGIINQFNTAGRRKTEYQPTKN